ncbi:MAG: hypothetical protein HZA02_04705 [Nitrospinae bacterium]|nr:hypothetical protein [Nitrospinota bacterium]
MPLKIIPKTFRMANEDRQLEEILKTVAARKKGETVLFPEYAAYTVEGSKRACAALSEAARKAEASVVTTLNLPAPGLPHAEPGVNYNALFVFSRNGRTHSPQAKITPQSFEMRRLDEAFPKMDVAPYSRLNRVRLRQDGEESDAFFFICSDLYALQLFDGERLKSGALVCPANFGNGAEGAAGQIIDYSVKCGLFRQGFLCNTYQDAKDGAAPLTVAAEKIFEQGIKKIPYAKEEMDNSVKRSSAVYPDERYRNFKNMLSLTRNGTFTVPRSRSLESGLQVALGTYGEIVDL